MNKLILVSLLSVSLLLLIACSSTISTDTINDTGTSVETAVSSLFPTTTTSR
ncbi:MAG: hypothetical protein R6X34_10725 [Chloroflexota bacterium]